MLLSFKNSVILSASTNINKPPIKIAVAIKMKFWVSAIALRIESKEKIAFMITIENKTEAKELGLRFNCTSS